MFIWKYRPQETITIGEDIVVTIIHMNEGNVSIGVKAPKEMKIQRGKTERYGQAHDIKCTCKECRFEARGNR